MFRAAAGSMAPMPLDPSEIGRNIRRLRTAQGLTQEQLALKAGRDRVTLAKIETGRRTPDLATLADIARALAVPIGALTGEIDAGSHQVDELLERFRRSPWYQTMRPPPTEEEIEWVRSLGDVIWTRLPANEEAVQYLILIRRSEQHT